MPRLFNLGSLNIDLVYRVPHIVQPGETLASHKLLRGAGGKGLNQSLAAARAGAEVVHLGCIGADGAFLRDLLAADGVDVSNFVTVPDTASGHAIIQVAEGGENAIVLHPGANQCIRPEDLASLFSDANAEDWFLTQNETGCVQEAILEASKRGLKIAFNPAPMGNEVAAYPLELLDLLVVNETEAIALTGVNEARAALPALRKRLPNTVIVLTLGADGALLSAPGEPDFHASAPSVNAIDTTAAGDTFIGYLLSALLVGKSWVEVLELACRAAALGTTRVGAATSIPNAQEVERFAFF